MSSTDNTAMGKNAELLKRLTEDDTTALEEIYDVYYARIRFFASNILAGDEECQDITVKAFYKVWVRRMKFDTFNGIIRFLFIATRNLCLDHLRNKKKYKKNLREYAFHLTNEFHNPEEANVDQELLSFIELSMGKSLRGKKKSTLLLTIQGKKDSEIASALNISLQTVQNYRFLAIKILQKQFLDARMKI